jgi:uncharacterized DUF497 family protein
MNQQMVLTTLSVSDSSLNPPDMNRVTFLSSISKLSVEEFTNQINATCEVSEKRASEFYDVITRARNVKFNCLFDIEEFALKTLFPSDYSGIQTIRHAYSTSELMEYDPAKNGKNLVKHGISFNEVVSYSKNFGTLIITIPCLDNSNNNERVIIFSGLVLNEQDKLQFPLSKFSVKKYTISIAELRDEKFRFISSRVLSSEKSKYTKTVKKIIKKIQSLDDASKECFMLRCIEIIERDLITMP